MVRRNDFIRRCKLWAHSDGTGTVPAARNREEPLSIPSGLLAKSFSSLFAGLRVLVQVMLVAWVALAIYYSNLPWPWLRIVLAGAFAAFTIFAFFSRDDGG